MKFKIKNFTPIVIFILINITLINTLNKSKFHNRLRNISHSKSSNNQYPHVSVTVDPHQVEADDVGFSVVNIPVHRKPSVSTSLVANGHAVISHPHQDPIAIQTHPMVNIHPRPYLPNSNPQFPPQNIITSKNIIKIRPCSLVHAESIPTSSKSHPWSAHALPFRRCRSYSFFTRSFR